MKVVKRMAEVFKIEKKGQIIENKKAAKFDIKAQGVILINCQAEESEDDGFLVREGCGAELINCSATKCKRRGLQVDKGYRGGITIRGGLFAFNRNDGIGIDGGDIRIYGTFCLSNGGNEDSRDGLQISGRPTSMEIIGCRFENHHNAGLIIEAAGGLIKNNYSVKNRHGIAISGNEKQKLEISQNMLLDIEFGIFFYEKSPKEQVFCYQNTIVLANLDGATEIYIAKGLDKSKIIVKK